MPRFELPSDDEVRYHGLMRVWSNQTSHLSFIQMNHPAFLEILSMKDKIDLVNLALWDLEHYCHNSFAILGTIVPKDKQPIVPENMRGRISQLKELWWNWGQTNGYLK